MKKFKLNYSKRNMIIIVISIIVAVLGLKVLEKSITVSQTKKDVKYIVAASELKPGDAITKDNVKEATHSGDINFKHVTSVKDIEGLIVTDKIYQEEPIINERLDKEIDDSIDAKKQYSIKLLPEEAVAGTIRPGDKVKIVGTLISNSAGEAKTDYIIKDESGQPKSLKVISVFDSNGGQLSGENVPAGMFILEVTKEEAVALDKAVSTQKVKLVKDVK
ncbi:hypothetical protein [Clostridium sulfidigenes]|uniref:hypothetical protein n=1 Tax=Clostridium sulfidigenes TaxID=318464 RepID=UPI003F8BED7B